MGGRDAPKLTVFVSYSRSDLAVADRVVEHLEESRIKCLIDRRDLPYGEAWRRALSEMIREADAVVYLVSPRSVGSQWCRWELSEVSRLSKRLIPIVIEATPPEENPPEISAIHLMPFEEREPEAFAARTAELVDVLLTDRAWVLEHSRLSRLAQRWDSLGRKRDALLRGVELAAAEQWRRSPRGEQLSPGHLIEAFISDGRAAEARWQRTRFRLAIAVAAVALALSGVAVWQGVIASENARLAELNAAEARRQAEVSAGLRDEATRTALRTAEQQASILGAAADQHEDPTTAALVALEAWSGAGGAFPGFAALDERLAEAEPARRAAAEELQPALVARAGDLPNYASAASRVVRNLATSRERIALFHQSSLEKHWASSKDGRRLAMLQTSGEGLIWELGRLLEDDPAPQDARVFGFLGPTFRDISMSADGSLVAGGAEDGGVYVWDASSSEGLVHLNFEKVQVRKLVFAPAGRRLAVAFDNGAIAALPEPAPTGPAISDQPTILAGHSDSVTELIWTPSGDRLISAGYDGRVLVWDPDKGAIEKERRVGEIAYRLAVSSDGAKAAALASNGVGAATTTRLEVWELEKDRALLSVDGARGRVVFADGDDPSVVFATAPGALTRVSLAEPERRTTLKCGESHFEALAYLAELDLIAASDGDGVLCAWDAGDQLVLRVALVDAEDGQSIRAAPAGDALLITDHFGPARVFDTASRIPAPRELSGCPYSLNGLYFTLDGRHLVGAAGPTFPGLCVWRVEDGALKTVADVQFDHPVLSRWPAGRGGFVGVARGRAVFWRPGDDAPTPIEPLQDLYLERVLVASDGRTLLAEAVAGGGVFALTRPEAAPVRLETEPGESVRRLSVAESAGLLATLSAQNKATLWDARSGERLLDLSADEFVKPPTTLSLSKDGRELRAMLDDGGVRRWGVSRTPDGVLRIDESGRGALASSGPNAGLVAYRLPVTERVIVGEVASGGQTLYEVQSLSRLPNEPVAVSPPAKLLAQYVYRAEGSVVALHPLPQMVSEMGPGEGWGRAADALRAGAPLDPAETRYWMIEGQRRVYRAGVRRVARCLTPSERRQLGVVPTPPCWCAGKQSPSRESWSVALGADPFEERNGVRDCMAVARTDDAPSQ